MAKTLKGQCFCGAVKYRLNAAPMFVHCCHCKDCQRQTGSAFVINALIEAKHVASDGTTEIVTLPTDSGRPHDVTRCPTCRTALWSDYGRRKTVYFIRVGTLDKSVGFASGCTHLHALEAALGRSLQAGKGCDDQETGARLQSVLRHE